ncbi:MAG: class I SAM-dependent methyltransferase [Planctomycetota bacterium]|jgi:predicted O-methyltransferase YrrM
MAEFKYKQPENFRKICGTRGLDGKVATHHCLVADLLHDKPEPVILELGTCEGLSTSLLLTECEKQKGSMVSVDIEDRSDVAVSENWLFVKSNDIESEYIIDKAPVLKKGIDLLHIDSLHTYEHVKSQLMVWYKHVKQGGYITFHDVDPFACSPNGFKPSASTYQDLAGDLKAVKEFFYANQDDLFLEIHYGATGMAIMKKLSPLGSEPDPPVMIKGYKPFPGIRQSFKLLINAFKNCIVDRATTSVGKEQWQNRYAESDDIY